MCTKFCLESLKIRLFETHGHSREDKIKINTGKIELEIVYCIHLAQDRDGWQPPVNTMMNTCSIQGGNVLTYLAYCRLFKRNLLRRVTYRHLKACYKPRRFHTHLILSY